MRELAAFICHPVEVWRAVQRGTEGFNVAVPKIITKDDDNIWLSFGFGCVGTGP
jgi:hypothetical protein